MWRKTSSDICVARSGTQTAELRSVDNAMTRYITVRVRSKTICSIIAGDNGVVAIHNAAA